MVVLSGRERDVLVVVREFLLVSVQKSSSCMREAKSGSPLRLGRIGLTIYHFLVSYHPPQTNNNGRT